MKSWRCLCCWARGQRKKLTAAHWGVASFFLVSFVVSFVEWQLLNNNQIVLQTWDCSRCVQQILICNLRQQSLAEASDDSHVAVLTVVQVQFLAE